MQITVETLVKAPIAKVWSAYTTPEDNGGLGIACSWCRDKWGISWQIAPAMLIQAITHPDPAKAKRAFEAMMTMVKIDIATIEAALRD